MNASTKKKIQKKCKIRGYNIKPEALEEILSFVTRFESTQEEDEATDIVLDHLEQESLKSAIIDVEPVQRVVNLLLAADGTEETNDMFASSSSSAIGVIDVFDIPRYKYDPIRRNFYQHPGSLPRLGDPPAKSALYRDRFLLLSQRLSRHQDFSRPAFESELSQFRSCEISPIQSLVGRKGRRWVMGVISQLEDGHFYLEDLSASVEINLTDAKITTGFFLENTIVVAEGEMLAEGIFQIFTCGFPPLEDRDISLQVLAGHDFFGGGTFTKEETIRQVEMEKRAVNDMFVILSDIWLDKEETFGKLEIVLDGFESVDVVPSLFVFMGDFCSEKCSLAFNAYSSLRSQFGKLGQIIAARPRLKENCRFLFIPGPGDAGSTALPRCALPKYLTEELQNYISGAIFSSNPCRVKFYTQEIVFFRQDQLYNMRRSCLLPPSETETVDPFQHLVATITHQSHLCPLPLTKQQPIIWNYDHSLHLYPNPHTIVLGDRSPQKAFKYTGITCFNTGSFSMDSTFVVYRPCSQEVELSSL
ncbi:DNA polymerase epsilon subunit B [Medicago truncatula]|uniref:DNA polymerase epsilon subunit n=2 Tax=Medicago truncatula TaxID=3880 RepID=A0A072UBG5_MEDTR|nr:DNA polymerase epsilon subunit B [Medicago truncatula]KEH26806.1 DNA polymerase epsilon subunit B [Medicago truncatula]